MNCCPSTRSCLKTTNLPQNFRNFWISGLYINEINFIKHFLAKNFLADPLKSTERLENCEPYIKEPLLSHSHPNTQNHLLESTKS